MNILLDLVIIIIIYMNFKIFNSNLCTIINIKFSNKFYKSLGAISLDEWRTYRLDESKFDYLVKVKATN